MAKRNSAIMGAAFLMATSAIGPGFLTQTTVFTNELLTNFGFVILISILLDIGAQLNIWRIVTMARKPAQVLANSVIPGAGTFLAILIAFGGLAFNIGNIAGTGLGLNALLDISPVIGSIISTILVLLIFWYRESLGAIDLFTKILGMLMIGLTLYIAVISDPPLTTAIQHTFLPERFDFIKIITIVGGTVGGYISFAGAHRLLDAGIGGNHSIKDVNRSSITGIVLTSLMRYILFLAVLGVVTHGAELSTGNPAASVFENAAGTIGKHFFGLVMWSASITSVVGATYTSISFIKTLHPAIDRHQQSVVTVFVIISLLIFLLAGHPVLLLILAGALNGIILPVALTTMLIAARKLDFGDYRHPSWLRIIGWIVVLTMGLMALYSILQLILS